MRFFTLTFVTMTILSTAQSDPAKKQLCKSAGESIFVTSDLSSDGKSYLIQAPLTNNGLVILGGTSRTSAAGVLLRPGDKYTANPIGHNEVLSESYDLSHVYFGCESQGDSLIWKVQ